ncbi:MAG: flap endonuclease-1 [Candidatus Hydrothermarchaeales archaeon]
MGVQLANLVTPKVIDFGNLKGKRIAVDALNTLYQFLSIIRQPDGTPLKDSKGRITSHLSGLFYRNANLMDYGILPIYVFDGKHHRLKGKVVAERKRVREEAREKWKVALAEKKLEEARTFAQQSSRITDELLSESKELLECLGIPYVQAPSEGEAQAAGMVERGDAWAVGSQDYDSLLFGSSRLVRNLAISGRRKIPRRKAYVSISPDILRLKDVLKELGVTREQLVDIAILIGTDYNPKGVEGIGPKKAFAMIKEYGSAAEGLEALAREVDFDIQEIRELFLEPGYVEDYELEWRAPDEDRVLHFLCDERGFSVDRMKKGLEKFKGAQKLRAQSDLDAWFN